jgi:hypothetical protein
MHHQFIDTIFDANTQCSEILQPSTAMKHKMGELIIWLAAYAEEIMA